ncbi:MAG: Xaa-Pro dipeptidase [Pelotomaculum sp. PtaB.Bin013]|uniref:Xaa-Pro peptidase family protein n=1 Tax=Pelotomaculum isophthalicicum JI TaxID=947010 RepID=A0A9X4H2L3_9FIRM|nr:Xaa-Pro peptidase family protein [Pelotomaculum isophthalicicum]MDF9408955.1 Xaa-Pro peptidase family protein [Pelotomaculum isophthalicicum JI]OPX90877.1 MAG: Xaa-Pro dipeptidase [Pelotomaculum sp. PtaB.Bin013]
MRITPKFELERRIKNLQDILKRQGIDGAMIIQNVDVFYFAGTMQRAHLFIPADGLPVLMVKRSFIRASEESALENIIHLENPKEMVAVLKSFGYGPFNILGFELDVLPVVQYQRYHKLFEKTKIIDVSPYIRSLRMVKSPYELGIINESAGLNQEIYGFIRENIREGITELELAGDVEAACRKRGHIGMHRLRGFNQELGYGHLMSGSNLAVSSYFDGPTGGRGPDPSFPQSAGYKLIGKNEPVLVDYGFVYDGYIVDQTRIFCIGKLPDHLVRAYSVAYKIQERIKTLAKPGVMCAELYDSALEIAEASDFGEHFMGYPERVSFIGHGVGLELDEMPVVAAGIKTPLEEGMVLAIEPKFVFQDGAVGIENTFVVTADGLKTLTIFDEDIIYI